MTRANALIKKNEELLELEQIPGTETLESSSYGYDDPSGKTHLRDYWRMVRKYVWMVVGIVLLTTTLATVYVAQKADYFQAESRVQVNMESNPAAGSSESSKVIVNSPVNDPAYFTTQLQILEGTGLLRRVVRVMDLEHNQAFLSPRSGRNNSVWQNVQRMFGFGNRQGQINNPAMRLDDKVLTPLSLSNEPIADQDAEAERLAPYVALLKSGLEISAVKENRVAFKETRLIDIEYTHYDPEIAAKIANAIADAYVLSNLEKKVETNAAAGDFLQKRVAELQSQIRSAEERLINYAKNNQILSLDEGQNIVVQRLADLNSKLAQAESERINAETAYRAALAPNAASAQTENSDNRTGQLESTLATLKQQREQMRVEYTEEWPGVIQLNKQIAAIESDIQKTRNKATTILTTNLATTYRQAQAREQELRKIFNNQRVEVLSQNEAAINYRIIQQEIDINKSLLTGLLQRSKENDVILNGTPNNVLVVDRALVPRVPIGPQRLKDIMIAFLASLGLGIGLAFLLEYMNDTVRSGEEVENRLFLPVLATIPSMKGTSARRFLSARFASRWNNGNGNSALRVIDINEQPATAEAYLQLRTYVLLSSPGGAPKTILITSAQASEGKTTTAVNMAKVLAQTGDKTLLIDADLRCPRIHTVFDFENSQGLTRLLTSDELSDTEVSQAIRLDEKSGVYVLTSGPMSPSPANLLGSTQMSLLISMLETRFTHVIIDSPPVIYFADSVLISSVVDGVLMVIRSNETSRELVIKARKMLQNVGARIIGAIMNDVSPQSKEYYKYYDTETEPPPSQGKDSYLKLNAG